MGTRVSNWVVVLMVSLFASSIFAQELSDKCSLQPPIKEALVAAKEIELFSLNPAVKKEDAKTSFHGWSVLGSTKIAEKDVQAKVIKEVETGISESRYGEMALCFHPRHGVRAKSGDVTVELVICFECSRVKVFVDGKLAQSEATKEVPQKYLDELLMAAKVQLAPKAAKDK